MSFINFFLKIKEHFSISKDIKNILEINEQKIKYIPDEQDLMYDNNQNDIERFKEYFLPIMLDNNFLQIYKNTIKNLPQESVLELSKIVLRIFTAVSTPANQKIDLFTASEKEILKHIQGDFERCILMLSEEDWAYCQYFLPENHFESQIFFDKLNYNHLHNKNLFRNRDILDVGGFIGDTALILSEWTDRHVYIFEPLEENCVKCKKTLEKNNIKNAIIEKVALGTDGYSSTFYIDNGGASSFFPRKGIPYIESKDITTISLDSYMKDKNINPGLIKVDIEGFEQEFLLGSQETIKKYKPDIMISIYHKGHDLFFIKTIIESWNLGYSFRIWKPINRKIVGEAMLICEQK